MAFDPYGGYQAPGANTLPLTGAGGLPGKSSGTNLAGSNAPATSPPANSAPKVPAGQLTPAAAPISPSPTTGGAARPAPIAPGAAPTPTATPTPAGQGFQPTAQGSYGAINNAAKNQTLVDVVNGLATGAVTYQNGRLVNAQGVAGLGGSGVQVTPGANNTLNISFPDPGSEGTVHITATVDPQTGKVQPITNPGQQVTWQGGKPGGSNIGTDLLDAAAIAAAVYTGGASLDALGAAGAADAGATAGLTASDLATSELASSQLAASGLTAADVAGASGAGVDAILGGAGTGAAALGPAAASLPEGGYNPALLAANQGATATDVVPGELAPGNAVGSAAAPGAAGTPSALTPAAAPDAGVNAGAGTGLGGDTSGLNALPTSPTAPTATPVPQGALSPDMAVPDPTAAGSSTGFMQKALDGASSLGSKALTSVENNPLQAAALGLTGYNMVSQQQAQKSAQDFANQLKQLGIPLNNASNQLLAQYASGKLNPGDQYAIQQFVQQNIAQAKQYYASAGLGDSSMAQQAIQAIEAQGQAMTSAALQGYLTSATNLATAGNAPITAGINQQIATDQQLQNSQTNVLQALAQMAAAQNNTANPKKPQGS